MREPPTPPPSDPGAAAPESVEQQLRLAEQRLAFHVENTPLAVIEWDRDLRVARWNAQAERVFGWSAAEVVGKGMFDFPFVLEGNREMARRMTEAALAGREPRSVVTTANHTKSGGVVWCEWYNSISYDGAGKMASALSLALDVTGRRATAEALALSQARVRAALDGARMLAWDLDLATGRWETTADLAEFFGPGPNYDNSQMALANVHPDDVPIVLAGRQRAVEADEPMRYEYRGRAPAPDGRPRWFSTTGRVLRDEAGRPVRIVAVTTDITERRRAEAEREELDRQLREAQRWESLGVLAGGVAHDFNNILAAIQGAAGLARRGLPPGSPAQAHLDQIEQGCGRAANVCRQMLAYAGHARSAGGATDLAALVRESVPLLEIPAGPAAVKLELGANIPPVPVDPAHVRQVLVGLATNAAEALGGGAGTVTVGARLAEVLPGGSDVGFQIAPAPGRYAVLTVSDTGCGMAPDVRARMFDPFFTTKFPGRGLGLAAVLGIVRTHGGGLHVATAPGRGTIVSAYWPLPAGAAPPPPPVPSTAAALVIDDEMYVREVTASALQEMGYSPLLAADGPSGVELFRRHRDVIKVAVIDAVMPGMSGEQVLESLREMDPALPAVLVSALADRRAARSSGARTAFVLKPFHPEELMEAVRRLA